MEYKLQRSPYIITSLDLEMNTDDAREIIQIGACVGDIRTNIIFEKLSCIIKIKNKLHNFDEHGKCDITKLTGITQKDVDNGISIFEAYKKVSELHNKVYNTINDESYKPFRNPLTWGGGDSLELLEELNRKRSLVDKILKNNFIDDDLYCFGRRWIDVKTLFLNHQLVKGETTMQGGLSRSLIKVGLQFKGRKHNALDDAINTFYMRSRLFNLERKI